MKVEHLLTEVSFVRPDWVVDEQQRFKDLVAAYDFVLQDLAFYDKSNRTWIFGGMIKGGKKDSFLPLENRFNFLRTGIGKHLIKLAKEGREPRIETRKTKQASWWRMNVPRIIHDTDTLVRISGLLNDTIYINTVAGQPFSPNFPFYFTLTPPSAEERAMPSPVVDHSKKRKRDPDVRDKVSR